MDNIAYPGNNPLMMKKIWLELEFFFSIAAIPAGVFAIYSAGGLIFEGNWQMFLIASALFLVCIAGIAWSGIKIES